MAKKVNKYIFFCNCEAHPSPNCKLMHNGKPVTLRKKDNVVYCDFYSGSFCSTEYGTVIELVDLAKELYD